MAGQLSALQWWLERLMASKKNDGLGQLLASLGFIRESDMAAFMSQQCRIPTISLDEYEIDASVIELVPKELCRAKQIIPVSQPGCSLVVAMSDPTDATAIAELGSHTGLTIEPVIAAESSIRKAIDKYYGSADR